MENLSSAIDTPNRSQPAGPMTCSLFRQLAPRIAVYPFGSPPPSMEQDWLALPQLSEKVAGATVFGDGSHPTTRLCAGVLDLLCRQRQPAAVLDVGTGTGVLARIARARGAHFIVGTDIDPLALSGAEAHSVLDSHPVPIHFSPEAPDYWGARFDLVVANILEQPLGHLAPALSRALQPGGLLLLSGFTRPQTPALRVLYGRTGVTFVRESNLDEWSMLMFERCR
jgi:ribosomal protein L11 methyltransferase